MTLKIYQKIIRHNDVIGKVTSIFIHTKSFCCFLSASPPIMSIAACEKVSHVLVAEVRHILLDPVTTVGNMSGEERERREEGKREREKGERERRG